MAKIDIIMPVKNQPEPLPSAILSILYQTERDIRLIIINDGSGPKTVEIMNRFARDDQRVTVIPAHGAGIVDALNTGLDHATAPYIARMDGDDVALPTRLAKQLAVMEAHPHVGLCGTTVIRFGDENGLVRLPHSASDCRRALRIFNCFYHPTVMMRHQTLADHAIRYSHEYEYAEDYKLFCDLAAVGDAVNIAEPLLLYRIHGGQVSTLKKAAQQRAALNVVAHQNGTGGKRGLFYDIHAMRRMAREARLLGRSHAGRSLNAFKNSLAATKASFRDG